MKCKGCGINYHYCGDCDKDDDKDKGYCSYECREKAFSDKHYLSLKLFMDSLDSKQVDEFKKLAEQITEFGDIMANTINAYKYCSYNKE